MAKSSSNFVERGKELLSENGRLLTVFGVATIIIGGITLVQYPQNWWIALLAVVGFFFALFLFINARVVIKVLISIVVTFFIAGISFNLGANAEPTGAGAFIWFFGTLIVYLVALSISYFLPSGSSRWSAITLTVMSYFTVTWLLAILTGNVLLSAALSIVIALSLFTLMYLFGPRSRFSAKHMPEPYRSEELSRNLRRAAAYAELNFRPMVTKEDTSYLVWRERAYVLYPIRMEQAFGVMGRRHQQLSYKEHPINSWLRSLSFMKNPYFKSRGAETLLVLVDMDNANGKETKTIGVSVADSKRVVPVGIMPGKLLKSEDEKALQKALASLDENFESFVTDLTPKQQTALSKFGDVLQKPQEVTHGQ